MANLLDKASILLTPTAYNNGSMLSVKPTDGDGDFTFSRNSAATRVNAQGLVENVQILSGDLVQNGSFSQIGAEEVTNGSFTNGSTDWTLGTGWSIGEDKAICDGSSTNLDQTGTFTSSTTYKVVYTIEDYVSGDTRFRFTGTSNENGTLRNSNGTYTEYIKLTNNQETLRFIGSGVLSITNISVKEVGQNWSFGDGFTPDQANSKATCDGTQSAVTNLTQTISTNIQNKLVRVSFTLDYTAGVLLGSLSGTGAVDFNNITSSGTYTAEMTSNEVSPPLILQGDANFIGSITNIVLIEITNDTNLPRINYEGFSYQDSLGSELVTNGDFSNGSTDWTAKDGVIVSANSSGLVFDNSGGNGSGGVFQNIGLSDANKYKMTATMQLLTGASNGTFSVFSSSANGTGQSIVYTGSTLVVGGDSVTETFEFSPATGDVSIQFFCDELNATYKISNVSVKEYFGQEVVPDSGCGSWLLEDESTNLITQSELFSDASWVKSRSTYTSDAIKSPSCLINMGYLTEDTTATNTHYMRTFLTLTDGVDYTLSVFAKAKERNIICLGDNAAAQSNTGVWFDLTNGVVLTQRSGYVGSIKDFGNGIYRCSVIYSAAAARQYADIAISLSDGVNVYTGDGTSGVYIWGAQLEQQSHSSSYIPTSGASSTRLQDLATDSGNATLINSTEGVFYAEIKPNAIYNLQRWLSLSDGSQNNTIKIGFLNSSTNLKIAGEVRSGGVSQAFMAEDFGAVSLAYFKVAVKYKENDFALWINGVEVVTDTSGVTPIGLNQSSFNRGNNVQQFLGKTKAVAVYKEALTDAQLTALTTI